MLVATGIAKDADHLVAIAKRIGVHVALTGHDRTSALRPGRPGVFYVFAVYCLNDQVMSETTAWTGANGPTDPRMGELFRQLFMVIWSDSPALRRGGRACPQRLPPPRRGVHPG